MQILPSYSKNSYNSGSNSNKNNCFNDKYVHNNFNFLGVWIPIEYFRIVIIPFNNDNKSNSFIYNIKKYIMTANGDCAMVLGLSNVSQFIISDPYYLYDVKTIKKFNIPITISYIRYVCRLGHSDVLDWLCKNKSEQFLKCYMELKECEDDIPSIASEYGNVNVLDWWFNSGLELRYNVSALDRALYKNHISVLEWWKKSGLLLKCSDNYLSLYYAVKLHNFEILEWWKNSGLSLDLLYNIMMLYGDIHILNWWKNSGLSLASLYNDEGYKYRCGIDRLNFLYWWKISVLPLDALHNKYNMDDIIEYSESNLYMTCKIYLENCSFISNSFTSLLTSLSSIVKLTN